MKRLVGAFALFTLTGLVFACATEDDASVRPLAASKKDKDRSDDDDNDSTAAPVATSIATSDPTPVSPIDAGTGGTATTYVGTLAETPTVRFGGSPYCFYDVRLKNVKIEVAVLPNGSILGAQVTDVMVENSVPPCTLGAAPPADCSFAYTTSTNYADGIQLAFNGAKGNHPATKLVVDLKKVGSSYEAEANWHRTDQKAPLDWTVTTKITLGPR